MARSSPDHRLDRVAKGDADAFRALYRAHSAVLLAYLRRRVASVEDAADLTAEVFADALAHAARYDPDRGPERAWLFGIANHKLAAYWRAGQVETRARRRLGLQRLTFDDHALERAEEKLDAQRLAGSTEALLAGLPEDERDAVRARIVDERSYAEIAGPLDLPEATVRKRVSRGLARLASARRT
jgi:RNA polymerase sigma factor (sigma-70 family)